MLGDQHYFSNIQFPINNCAAGGYLEEHLFTIPASSTNKSKGCVIITSKHLTSRPFKAEKIKINITRINIAHFSLQPLFERV